MSGHRSFKEIQALRGPMTPERRARIDKIKSATEGAVALPALRMERGATQAQIASALGTTQAAVSQLERRGDLFVSTMRDYIAALGGELELVAVFPSGERVQVAPAETAAVTN